MKPKYYTGTVPSHCEVTGLKITDVFFDARDPSCGLWAFMCEEAFNDLGCSLGVGRGQRYSRQTTPETTPQTLWLQTPQLTGPIFKTVTTVDLTQMFEHSDFDFSDKICSEFVDEISAFDETHLVSRKNLDVK